MSPDVFDTLDTLSTAGVEWMLPHHTYTRKAHPGELARQMRYVSKQSGILLRGVELGDRLGFYSGSTAAHAVEQFRRHVNWPAHDAVGGWPYVNDQHLLYELVHRYLIPQVNVEADQVRWVGGNVNPLRCDEPVRGEALVTWKQVAEVTVELFPPRSLGWLRLHSAVSSWVCGYTIPGPRRAEVASLTEAAYARLGEVGSHVVSRMRHTELNSPWTHIVAAASGAVQGEFAAPAPARQ